MSGYNDDGHRAMRTGPAYVSSVEEYSAICKDFVYFGLEAGNECYCDNDFIDTSKYHPRNCGDMGGGWCIKVYKYTSTRAYFLSDLKQGYQAIGSFKGALRFGPKAYGFSIESCRDACPEYKYFSLQNGGQCFCDNDIAHAIKYGDAVCGLESNVWCN